MTNSTTWSDLLQAVVQRLDRGGSPDRNFPDRDGEYWALCPFHPDKHPENFSVSEAGYHCFACGASGGLWALAEKFGVAPHRDASPTGKMARSSAVVHANSRGNTPPLPPTLENYAAAKRLPVEFLESLGLATVHLRDGPAVKMPYFDGAGEEIGARLRIALEGKNRFKWRKGTRVQPYGLWRLDRSWGAVILCEGESDAQTFWFHGVPALGIPGAALWQAEWANYVAGLRVYVWQEPDQGGQTFSARVGASLPDCLILTPPEGGSRKDISECHIAGLAIPELVEKLRKEARAWREIRAEKLSQDAAAALAAAGDLPAAADILERFAASCRERGLVGEDRTAKLLFLAGVSRLLDRPVSCVVKGASSSGKSVTVATVFEHFPPSAYYALSSMSEHSMAYSNEPLVHRILILYEAAGMTSEMSAYFIRSLLSEGKIRYETVEKTREGMQPRLIEREGPTGLIVTTTGASLHPENETRMLSLTVRDDPLQTAGVLQELADRANGARPPLPDYAPWHALQTWLELAGRREVTIPYAHQLALLADARAVRLRRDFGAVLNLVRAHAILHQSTRSRDAQGRILATLADYAAVYDLVIDIIAQGVQATVSAAIRETVAAVKELDTPGDPGIKIPAIAKALGIDRSAVSRRVRVASEDGYLVNLEERKGRPARITLGDPLPEERAVLPHPDALAGETGGGPGQSTRSSLHECTSPTQAMQGGGLLQSPRSSLHECTSPAQAMQGGGPRQSPRKSLHECTSPAQATQGGGPRESPRSSLHECTSPAQATQGGGSAAAQGAFGWRPAQTPPTHDGPQTTLEPWQQSILDEFDP